MKKRMIFLLIPAMFLTLAFCASADELILPSGLTVIEEEAFAGDISLDEVVLPDGLTRIESGAFAGSGVTRIYLPESITYIAPDAFDQCELVTGYGPDRTYASDFFDEHGLNFEHTPRHIALLIGNGDYNQDGDALDDVDLWGPPYDVNAFEQALLGLNPAWEVTKRNDLKSTDILPAIDAAFSDSRACDICLFYYSGHGSAGGSLSCVDNWRNVTAQALANCLNQTAKGKVIVVLDCCYSGSMITGRGTRSSSPLAAFNAAVISAFSGYTMPAAVKPAYPDGITPKSGELMEEKFIVLTACGPDEESFEFSGTNSSTGERFSYGLMSYELMRALGCSYPHGNYGGNFFGDANKDSKLTLSEAYTYITSRFDARRTYVVDHHDQYYTDWQTDYNESHYYQDVYYAAYDDYFEARYDVYYHAYDQTTSTYGDGSFVLFER